MYLSFYLYLTIFTCTCPQNTANGTYTTRSKRLTTSLTIVMAHQFNGYNAFFVPAADVVSTTLSFLTHAESSSSPASSTLLEARTHPDMLPFRAHCAIVATCVDKLVSRVCGTSAHGWGYHDSDLTSYAALRTRLEAALRLLRDADPAAVSARIATGTLMLPGDDGEEEVPLHVYVSAFNMSYQYFHMVTAYNILRKEGVPLGKRDYMVRFNSTLDGQPLLWEKGA